MRKSFFNQLVAITSAFAFLLIAAPVEARECEGQRFPNRATVGETQLVLNGIGIREATVFNVDVYFAALYLENRGRNGAQIARSEQTKRLVLRFVREVDREKMTEAFNEGFANSGGTAAMAPKIRQLNRWMPRTVRDGSRFTFTYVPGTGLEVKVGRTVKGTIEGADFARAFFSIWLGANPPNRGLRRGLLGGECG